MMRTRELFLVAIGITVLSSTMLVGTPSPAGAQHPAAPAINDDDIGGIVTGPNGPEASVWLIAESVELATNFAKWSSPTIRHATSFPTCRR
jgi:hypothetical protein